MNVLKLKNFGILEEAFDMDVKTLNEVILPMFNVKRRTVTGYEDENEFDEQIIYVTTAGLKLAPVYGDVYSKPSEPENSGCVLLKVC